jgi:hypothetical protein
MTNHREPVLAPKYPDLLKTPSITIRVLTINLPYLYRKHFLKVEKKDFLKMLNFTQGVLSSSIKS